MISHHFLGQVAELFQFISAIAVFTGKPYSSHDRLNQDDTHGFFITVESVTARDSYVRHPKHKPDKAASYPETTGPPLLILRSPMAS